MVTKYIIIISLLLPFCHIVAGTKIARYVLAKKGQDTESVKVFHTLVECEKTRKKKHDSHNWVCVPVDYN